MGRTTRIGWMRGLLVAGVFLLGGGVAKAGTVTLVSDTFDPAGTPLTSTGWLAGSLWKANTATFQGRSAAQSNGSSFSPVTATLRHPFSGGTFTFDNSHPTCNLEFVFGSAYATSSGSQIGVGLLNGDTTANSLWVNLDSGKKLAILNLGNCPWSPGSPVLNQVATTMANNVWYDVQVSISLTSVTATVTQIDNPSNTWTTTRTDLPLLGKAYTQVALCTRDHLPTYNPSTNTFFDNVSVTYTQAAAFPTFSPDGGVYQAAQGVTISCATSGATIYYTDNGTTPSSTCYTGTFGPGVNSGSVSVNHSLTLQAIAYADGLAASPVKSATYTFAAATPTFSPDGGTYAGTRTVTISSSPSNAIIYYTLDNTTPTTNSASITSGQTVDVTPPKTLRAIATASGYANSAEKSAYYASPSYYSYSENFESYAPGDNMSTHGWTYSGLLGTDPACRVSNTLVDQGQSLCWTTDNLTQRTLAYSITPASSGVLPDNSTAVFTFAYSGTGYLLAEAQGNAHVGGVATSYYAVLRHPYSATGGTGGFIYMYDSMSATALYLNGSPTRNINQGKMRLIATKGEIHGYWKANWSDPWQEICTNASGAFVSNGWHDRGYDNFTIVPTIISNKEGSGITGTMGVDTISFWTQLGPVVDLYPEAGTYSNAQTVRVNTVPAGGTIYYTLDNTEPTTSSPSILDNQTISINSSSTLKILAVVPGWTANTSKTAAYTIVPTTATPTFSPDGGVIQAAQGVTISCTTSGATIYYTDNGTTPSSTCYTGTFGPGVNSGSVSVNHSLTLQAIAYADELAPSPVKSAAYSVLAAAPAFSPAGGVYPADVNVTISGEAGAEIWYTTDGSDPAQNGATSTRYQDPVTISGDNVTLKAKVWMSDKDPSAVQSAVYNVVPAANRYTAPVATLTLDGNVDNWPAASQWSVPFVRWNGTALTSTTTAKFAWNDADNVLYVAVQTNEAGGGQLVLGMTKNPNVAIPASGIGSNIESTQIQFKYDPSGNAVVTNGVGGVTTGVTAACAYEAESGIYTYEISHPLRSDWTNGTADIEPLWSGDVVYLYAVLESNTTATNGMDLTYLYDGSHAAFLYLGAAGVTYPSLRMNAWVRTAAITLEGGEPAPTPTPTPAPTPTPMPIPGDANRDGVVTFADFATLQNHYGQSVTGDTWSQGDFNGDRQVTFEDFSLLQNHYGESTSGSAPAAESTAATSPCSLLGLVLLAMMGLGLLSLRSQVQV